MKTKFGHLVLTVLFAVAPILSAQEWGVIKGQVQHGDGSAVSAAEVTLSPGDRRTLTNNQGLFSLTGVVPGDYTLHIEYIGFAPKDLTLSVKAGVNDAPTVVLEAAAEVNIKVVGSLKQSQARALNEQRLSANIKNIIAADQIGDFPDSNAAEATQRVPGITIARDQGEGRYVLVRGTEARLNKTVLNGETLPAPEGDLRTVALDVIPLDLLDAIEVTKAGTPDMDGDAVGGSINLVTRAAPVEPMLNAGFQYGYNELGGGDLTFGNIAAGRRFFGDKLGVIATFSSEETDRVTDNFEASYDDGELEELEQRDYTVNRKRIGGYTALDYRPHSAAHYMFNASYTQFDDMEFRRRLTSVPGDGELERELKDRFETQSILAFQFKGEILTSNTGVFKFSSAYGYAREAEPSRQDTTFKTEDILFDTDYSDPYSPVIRALNEDIANYEFDDAVVENNITNDEHLNGKLSYEWPVAIGASGVAQLKTGLKFRTKNKMRDQTAIKYEVDDLTLPAFVDPNYTGESILDNRYAMGAMPGSQLSRGLINLAGEGEIDFEEDSGDYDITEDQTAAYFMATIDLNDSWEMLPGVRYERIDADYTGKEVVFDEEGDYLETLTTSGSKSDDILMPMFHLKYKLADKNQLRFAVVRNYARARVFDQVPYRLLLREDNEIEEGNPDIQMTKVWNADLMYEKYFGETGILSLGLFYKDMTDHIFILRSDEDRNGQEFEVTRPMNGSDATMWGFEFAFQKNFTELPAPFDGLGVYVNFTTTDSEADFLDRVGEVLPGQSDEMGNLALLYENAGFSMRLSGNLQGMYLEEVGGDPSEDIFVDRHFQLDLSASYEFKNWRVHMEANNLNDEPVVRYEGDVNHPIQYEQYKIWARLGASVRF